MTADSRPQGSVLGPVLFLVFINSLQVSPGTSLALFADDARISRRISSQLDVDHLQADLDCVQNWARAHGMRFNNSKCVVQRFGSTWVPVRYNINGEPLALVEVHKDLGIQIDNKLNFSNHVAYVSSKANRTAGFIRRHFTTRCPRVLIKLFNTYVRSSLEYGDPVWTPMFKKDVIKHESVLRRFTKGFPCVTGLQYSERLSKFGIESLERRREKSELLWTFKLIRGLVTVEIGQKNDTPFYYLRDKIHRETRASLHEHLWTPHARSIAREKSFLIRVITSWNALPLLMRSETSFPSFKRQLSLFYDNLPNIS